MHQSQSSHLGFSTGVEANFPGVEEDANDEHAA